MDASFMYNVSIQCAKGVCVCVCERARVCVCIH
jgi:hypothetical protein